MCFIFKLTFHQGGNGSFPFCQSLWPNLPASCFSKASKLRMVFTLFNGWKKSEDKYFVTPKTTWNSNFSVYKSSFFGAQQHRPFIYCPWLLLCYSDRDEWLQQTVWPAQPQILILCCFTDKACWNLFHRALIFNLGCILGRFKKYRCMYPTPKDTGLIVWGISWK